MRSEAGSFSGRCPGARRIALAAFATLAVALPVHGRQIAVVLSRDVLPYREVLRGVEETLGPIDHVLDLDGRDGTPGALERLRHEPPDAVIAIGARAARVVTGRLTGTPTVFCMAPADDLPRGAGMRVASVTGDVPVDRQLAAFREIVPGLERLAVLYDPSRSIGLVQRARVAARSLGIDLIAEAVPTAEDVPSALRRTIRHVDGVWLIPDRTVVSHDSFRFVLGLAAERRVPLMVFSESMVRAGGLVGLVPDHAQVGRQAADLLLRLLEPGRRDTRPTVEAPRALRLVLNARTAANLGVPIPDELTSREGTHVYR